MIKSFNKISEVKGELDLPGDKSISHRSVMFSALAKGESKIYNLSNGEDVRSTQSCFSKMGIEIKKESDHVRVNGNGFKGLKKPPGFLDAGNSGTTARLISGILCAQDFESTIVGDESLSVRPMRRITLPLTEMGGIIKTSENNTLPIKILPSKKLKPITYELPMASAQVKSAVLLAGLHLDEESTVIEKHFSRDHTEKMLGLKTEFKDGKKISYSSKKNYPDPKEYFVPSDISTAAFFIVLAVLAERSELKIKHVSLNETRTGILEILKKMGAKIEIDNKQVTAGESFGDLVVYSSELKNVNIPEDIIPNLIDEIPVLSVAGLFAQGDFIVRNAEELRGKETDRIKALCDNYKKLGLSVEEFQDGFHVSGVIKNNQPVFESYGDHRIAMAMGVLSLLLKDGGKVNNFSCVSISNPNFINQLQTIVR